MEETRELAALTMSENKSKIKLAVNKDGFEASAEGRPAEDTAGILKSLLAPIVAHQEGKAEVIRHQNELKYIKHVHDEEVTRRIAGKALGLIEQRGIVGSKPNDKFFVPWLSAASLEDNSDKNPLPEMYAELLVSEMESANPNSLIYIDILRKLNKTHIQYLKSLLGGPYPTAVGNPAIQFGQNTIESLLLEPFNLEPNTVMSKLPSHDLQKQIMEANELPGVEMLIVTTQTYGDSMILYKDDFWFEWIREQDADCEGDQPDLIFSSLAALELVDRRNGELAVFNGLDINYTVSILSPLGWDFLRACNNEIES